MENAHDAAASVTLNVCPPMVNVPVRCDVFGLALALKFTVPLPLPLVPLVIVSQEDALLLAVQLQPPGAVTLVDPVPPAAANDWLVGEIANVQVAAA